MALVLVEGEDRLPSLIGASVNTTTTPGPGPSAIATTSSGLALPATSHRTAVIAALLSAMSILY